MVTSLIRSSSTFAQVFGLGHVYNPSASFEAPGWLPEGRPVLDFMTGGQLSVIGSMTVVCAQAVATRRVLELLADIGLLLPDRIEVFDSAASYRSVLSRLGQQPKSVVMQHVHPADELPAAAYWIERDLLTFLNNKANLGRLVPEGHVPRRSLVPPATLSAEIRSERWPVVIKAATDQSTGGGYDVRICKSRHELQEASRFFSTCPSVVVEEFLWMEKNLCVQFIATENGVHYLGTAEQVIDQHGRYNGNWLGADVRVPAPVTELGRAIMERAAVLGYRGFAGFDIAVLADGRIAAFDLNFRVNASTAALLLLPALQEHRGNQVIHLRTWSPTGSFEGLADVLRREADRGVLLPLSIFDPDPSVGSHEGFRLGGLVLGPSRSEVHRTESRLRTALAAPA